MKVVLFCQKKNYRYAAAFENGKIMNAEVSYKLKTTISLILHNDKAVTLAQLKEKSRFRKYYEIYQNEIKVGKIKLKKSMIEMSFFKDQFSIYCLNHNHYPRFYLFKDHEQVGYIDEKFINTWNSKQYVGSMSEDLNELLSVIIMLYIEIIKFKPDMLKNSHERIKLHLNLERK